MQERRPGRTMKGIDRKDEFIRIRVTEEQRRLFVLAANLSGLNVSSWLRSIGLKRASEDKAK